MEKHGLNKCKTCEPHQKPTTASEDGFGSQINRIRLLSRNKKKKAKCWNLKQWKKLISIDFACELIDFFPSAFLVFDSKYVDLCRPCISRGNSSKKKERKINRCDVKNNEYLLFVSSLI